MRENLIRLKARLFRRLSRGASGRRLFVESQLAKDLSYQIRAMRDREDWNQAALARRCGTSQNAISRHENPEYGKPSLTSLKKIAAAFDVALVVRFVPFGELADWVAGIPRTIKGLSETESLVPPNFTQEQEAERRQAAFGSSAAAFDDSRWFYRPLRWAMAPAVMKSREDEGAAPRVRWTKTDKVIPIDTDQDWGGHTEVVAENQQEKVVVDRIASSGV